MTPIKILDMSIAPRGLRMKKEKILLKWKMTNKFFLSLDKSI